MNPGSRLAGRVAASARSSRLPSRVVRDNPAVRRRLANLADRYQRATPDGRNELRLRLAGRTLDQAARTPYGRGLEGVTAQTSLSGWPRLDKATARADPERLMGRRLLPTVSASTGGTSGSPLRLRRSLFSLSAEQFFLDRILSVHGASFASSRHAVLRGDTIKDPSQREPPFGVVDRGGQRLVLSSAHLNADNLGWFVDELRRFDPEFLWAYPSTLSSLVRLVESAGSSLHLPLVVTSSETLYPTEARQAATHLGATVVDYYGQAERVALASNERGGGYRFDPLYGTVELLPTTIGRAGDDGDDGDAGDDGDDEASAEVVATGHWNSSMPLVRYAVGDTIRYRPSGDPDQLVRIARGEEPFEAIRGRVGDYLISPDGSILGAINSLVRGLRGVLRIQVRQESLTEVTVLVLTVGDFTDRDREVLLANCASRIPDTMRVTVERVDELPRTPAGKTPTVVRAEGLG